MKFIAYRGEKRDKAVVVSDSATAVIDKLATVGRDWPGEEVDIFLYNGKSMRQWDFPRNWWTTPKNKLIEHLEHCAELHEAFYAE